MSDVRCEDSGRNPLVFCSGLRARDLGQSQLSAFYWHTSKGGTGVLLAHHQGRYRAFTGTPTRAVQGFYWHTSKGGTGLLLTPTRAVLAFYWHTSKGGTGLLLTPTRAVLTFYWHTSKGGTGVRSQCYSPAQRTYFCRPAWLIDTRYWQLQSSGGCVLPSVNRTNSVFYTVGMMWRCSR